MVNKAVAALVLGVALVIHVLVRNWILSDAGVAGFEISLLAYTILIVYIIARSPIPDGDVFKSIIGTVTNMLWNIVWLTLAVLVYLAIMMLVNGGFDVMRLVSMAVYSVLMVVTVSIVYGAAGGLLKD